MSNQTGCPVWGSSTVKNCRTGPEPVQTRTFCKYHMKESTLLWFHVTFPPNSHIIACDLDHLISMFCLLVVICEPSQLWHSRYVFFLVYFTFHYILCSDLCCRFLIPLPISLHGNLTYLQDSLSQVGLQLKQALFCLSHHHPQSSSSRCHKKNWPFCSQAISRLQPYYLIIVSWLFLFTHFHFGQLISS